MAKKGRKRNRMKPSFTVLSFIILLAVAVVAGACSGSASNSAQAELTLAPESDLPDFVRDAAPQVKEAYRFAIANPDVLSAFPCYCGCGAMGHQNNLQCYIKEVRADGSMEFENHAFG
jgi:hypothetical protein